MPLAGPRSALLTLSLSHARILAISCRMARRKEEKAHRGERGKEEEEEAEEKPARKERLSPAERNNARVLNTVDDGNRNFVVEGRRGGGR